MADGWRNKALAEIQGIRPHWVQKHGWAPRVEQGDEHLGLHINFTQRSGRKYLLRLRYEKDFETAGRREAFVNPDAPDREGLEFWPDGDAFKKSENPPKICLEGVYGFHSGLHRDRDGRAAKLNKLLMEIQKCLNR